MSSPRRRFITLPRRAPDRIAAELDDELRFHVEMRAEELVARGMTRDEAWAEAVREMAPASSSRGEIVARDAASAWWSRFGVWLDEVRRDALWALRSMRRAPGYAAVTVLTLALAIGANTAVYSVVKAVLLDRLPFRASDELVAIHSGIVQDGSEPRSQISPADLVDYERESRSIAAMAAVASAQVTFLGAGEPEVWPAARVGGRFFDVLGVRALIGRTLRPADAEPGAPPVIVLTHATWRRAFGGDSSIVGRSIVLNGNARTVVGVLGPDFVMPFLRADAIAPLDLGPALAQPVTARKFHWLVAVGRLASGTTVARAKADLHAISVRLAERYPESNQDYRASAFPLRDELVGDARPGLIVLAGAAALVLLLACANIAGVLVARTLARRRDLAVRVSLGASRGRLARQLLTESLILALAGGALGLALGVWGERMLLGIGGDAIPHTARVAIDARVMLFTLAISLGSALLVGLAPALVGARGDVHDVLKSTSAGAGGAQGRPRLRAALVAGQIALSVVLLVGAGLLTRTLVALEHVDLGYRTSGMLTFHVSLGRAYDTGAKQIAFFDELFARLGRLPGARAVGGAGALPLDGGSSASLRVDGRPFEGAQPPEVRYGVASDGYFAAMGITLLRGRAFDEREREDGPHSVIISEALAQKFFPDRDPIGGRVKVGPNPDQPWETVVGVVSDVHADATSASEATVYESMRQDHWGGADVVVAVAPGTDPMSLLPSVRSEVRSIDRTLALTDVRTMDDRFARSLAGRRLPMLLLTAFAALALLLATLGVYSVMAYAVAARAREFGIRMALGARAREVLALVGRQALRTTLLGAALGVAGAVATTRFLSSLLYGVAPLDPATFVGVVAVLIVFTLVAAWLPARRATRVDVVDSLRAE
jgi:predicted permease